MLSSSSFSSSMSVLSIQSHVVHGYVGNKASTFPMQLFGIDVDPLNVVNFSNHTGYQQFRGRRTTVEEVRSLVEGLAVNRFLGRYDALLIGYIGDPDTLRYVKEIRTLIMDGHAEDDVRSDDEKRPPLLFVCDPVLGDNGKLYVSDAAVQVYRDCLCPLAQVVTPNGFEAEVLSGIAVNSVAAAQRAAQWFHDRGVPQVVIKSFHDEEFDSSERGHPWISFFVSEATNDDREGGGPTRVTTQHVGHVALCEGYFSGTGDLFGGILTSRLLTTRGTEQEKFHDIVFATMRSMQLVIRATADAAARGGGHQHDSHATAGGASRMVELRLVQSAEAILRPKMQDESQVVMRPVVSAD